MLVANNISPPLRILLFSTFFTLLWTVWNNSRNLFLYPSFLDIIKSIFLSKKRRPIQHITDIQTDRSKSGSYMETLYIYQDIFTKLDTEYFCNLWTNCSDQASIDYSCHVNWSIKIIFLYGKLFLFVFFLF